MEGAESWGMAKRAWRTFCWFTGECEVEALTKRVYTELVTGDEPYNVGT